MCQIVFICLCVSLNSGLWNPWVHNCFIHLYTQPSVEPLTHIRSSGHTENIISTEFVFVFYKGDMDFMVCGGKFYFHEKELFYPLCLIERWSLSLSLRVTFWVSKYIRVIIIILAIITAAAPTVYWAFSVCQTSVKHLTEVVISQSI